MQAPAIANMVRSNARQMPLANLHIGPYKPCSPLPSSACEQCSLLEGLGIPTKAGVLALDLVTAEAVPGDLFLVEATERSGRLMAAVDRINATYGRHTIFPAAAGIRRDWQHKRDRLSPGYTTRVEDLPVARIG